MGLFGPSREERLRAQREEEARRQREAAAGIEVVASVLALDARRKSKSSLPKSQWKRAQAQLADRYTYADVMESSALATKRLDLLKIPEPKPGPEDFLPRSVSPKMQPPQAKKILLDTRLGFDLAIVDYKIREETRQKELKDTAELIGELLEYEHEQRLKDQEAMWPDDVNLTPKVLAIEGVAAQVDAVNQSVEEKFQELANFLRATLADLPKRSDETVHVSKAIRNDPAYSVEKRLENALKSIPLPVKYYPDLEVGYSEASRQALIEFQLPDVKFIPTLKCYKYTRNVNRISEVQRPAAQIKSMYAELIAQFSLLVIAFTFAADKDRQVDTLVFNGYVRTTDPRSGHPTQPCLISVRVTRDQFQIINLSKVEPQACLRHLSASVSRSPSDLSPVRPILDFEMFDPRFVSATDAISVLDARPNLMDLTPGEFEGLIQNLFEKMGLEARQTQASRDGGVDCIAYDNRPIFGGKVVIQAKRYKNTVGVSAVRDLYGTLQNEGASKGILVTTSGYGAASFEFAQNKPIELLDGSNLLYLLQEHAGIDAKIEPPEGWRDPTPDSGEDF